METPFRRVRMPPDVSLLAGDGRRLEREMVELEEERGNLHPTTTQAKAAEGPQHSLPDNDPWT